MVIVQVPFTLLGVLLMDISGRRPLLMVSAAGTCLGCFLTGISFLLQDLQVNNWFSPILALVGVLVFSGSFSLGMGGIPWVIMSEIFPINIKGSAGSLVTVVNWFGSWVVSYAFNFLMKWSSEGPLSHTHTHTNTHVCMRVACYLADMIETTRYIC
ncbi:putative major facilitator, sugar transporter, major facilitator superfamily [Helianthus annuus]|nr:putative major facilitator, sugar transporter, major facilitator superfamily [Helianthus annuus]